MQIQPYHPSALAQAQLVDLINYCQNTEAHLAIKMAEQADIFAIPQVYQQSGGDFWVAQDDQQIVGCIALLPLDAHTGVLKKFFTYPPYRGQPVRLGAQLFDQLLNFARRHDFTRLVLDTPAAETRSHTFYEHHGFRRITASELAVAYSYPDRHSWLYELQL